MKSSHLKRMLTRVVATSGDLNLAIDITIGAFETKSVTTWLS